MLGALRRIFYSYNERLLKRYQPQVDQINELAPRYASMSDDELSACTEDFRKRYIDGSTLDSLLPEAFAALREASERALGMRHFDVQLLGGVALHNGNISEMATGEGKTLVATLPLYLNALTKKGVHLVTVNGYLAERDAAWMSPLYEFMNMSVGVVLAGQSPDERRAAYAADISYGTNNEFGFDYLRDHMSASREEQVQRDLHYAIVDEVDSILIDEARTPLIISGAAEDSSELYRSINRMMAPLKKAHGQGEPHYVLDEKQRQVELSEVGHHYVEKWLAQQKLLPANSSLYDTKFLNLFNHVHAALRAHTLYQRDVHYMVREDEVLLIDEHTGRAMPGRRMSEGLHQALEAREGLTIQNENQTLASITFQNYFRLYDKLAGMTGTAATEAAEFQQIYNLTVVVVPTNKPVQREDYNDLVYLSHEEKLNALVADIKELVEKKAAVLVGTVSIESSEELSKVLYKAGVKHEVLNAKQHEREAHIIAQAGLSGAVTIATNMAGRGTDIVLGGKRADSEKEEPSADWVERHNTVVNAGGLHVLGTERHESRRIDNQLRGRSGRQGDPGVSRFYLSMEDNLMRIFVSDRVKAMMSSLGLEKGEAIENKMVSNAIEKAQKRMEAQNFEARKQLLEYDDIIDVQRKVVYAQRLNLLDSENISEDIADMREEVLHELVDSCMPPQSSSEQWDIELLKRTLTRDFGVPPPLLDSEFNNADGLNPDNVYTRLHELTEGAYGRIREELESIIERIEKITLLHVLDLLWRRHLTNISQLRQGIHFRAYAQRNPKEEYKREAFHMFQEMLASVKRDTVSSLMHVDVKRAKEFGNQSQRTQQVEAEAEETAPKSARAAQAGPKTTASATAPQSVSGAKGAAKKRKIGRNEPCFCGSGQKYKYCCGR